MSFLDYFFDDNSSSTIVLYTVIVFLVFFFGCLSQRKNGKGLISFEPGSFILSFLILWFFTFFCDVGSDLEQYRLIFHESSFKTFTDDIFVEPGYKFICSLIKLFGVDVYLGVGFIKTLVLLNIYIAIYRLRKYIHIGTSLAAYTMIVYFMSFNVLRICLAASFVLLAFSFLIDNRKKTSMVLLFISLTIHYSAIISLVPVMFFLLFSKTRIDKYYLYSVIVSILIIFFSSFFVKYLTGANQYLLKYEAYLGDSGTFGLFQLVYYIPLMVLSLAIPRESPHSKLSIIIVWIGFAVAMCGYTNGMISRMNVYFTFNYMILLPYIINNVRLYGKLRIYINNKIYIYNISYYALLCIIFLYLFYKYSLELPGYFKASEICPYKMWI